MGNKDELSLTLIWPEESECGFLLVKPELSLEISVRQKSSPSSNLSTVKSPV